METQTWIRPVVGKKERVECMEIVPQKHALPYVK